MAYIPNPDLYQRMSAPYATAEEAQKAMADFCEEVRALREKHRIAEVVMIVGVYDEHDALATCQIMGDAQRSPVLAAALLRQTSLTMAENLEEVAAEWRKAAGEAP